MLPQDWLWQAKCVRGMAFIAGTFMTQAFGYSPLTPEQLLASVDAGEPLAARPGDWTVVSDDGPGKPTRWRRR
jgi:hypothetical protein